jgi:uncharacterized protein (TIGR02246 family)
MRMKAVVACALGLAMMGAPASTQMQPGKTLPELTKLAKEFEAAFNAKDAAKVAGLYAEDAIVMPANEPAVRGRANIETQMKKVFDEGVVSNLSLTPTESALIGSDHAYEIGTSSVDVRTPDGQTMKDRGKYLILLRKTGDRWLVTHDIWNSDSMPGPPPQ